MKRLGPTLALLVLAGCGGDENVPAATLGERLFGNPRLSTSPINVFACSTCHQVAGSAARIDSGFDLRDTVHRPSWWGGYVTRLIDAMNYCLTEFMGGAALDEMDPQARQLYEFLAQASPQPGPPALPLTVVKNVTDLAALTGDAGRGRDAFGRACQRCHGQPHSGAGKLGPKVSTIPEDTIVVFHGMARAVAVEKVRHGKFFNVGGYMPLYAAEQIEDQQIADILSYLGLCSYDGQSWGCP